MTDINKSTTALQTLQHFVGVVEDRNDPLNIGRVRVRCFGIHTENKDKIPTDMLPWAMPVMPFNSASISGIGISPTGPVEGTWVFGLFLDGSDLQQPIVLGTMVGMPEEKIPKTVGFSDPAGIYPKEKYLKQSDVNKLARGESAWGEESLAQKQDGRTTGIPTAVPPIVEEVRNLDGPVQKNGTAVLGDPKDNVYGVSPGSFYYRNRWDEPNPRVGGQASDTCFIDDTKKGQPWEGRIGTKPSKSTYPRNHVYSTESGHIMEYDDTPDAERIHQYHTKGTFYEIQPDGTRVTKVVGDDYEIFMKGKNVVVEGNMNLTVKGDVRLFVESNMYQEVKGDYHLRVDGDMVTKIQGNEQKIVLTDKATQVNGNRRTRISKNDTGTTEGDTEWKYKGTANSIHSNTVFVNVTGFERHLITESYTSDTGGNTNFTVGSRMNLSVVSNVNIETEANFNLDATAKIDMDSASNIEMDTPTNFLVGTSTTPAQATVKATRIDLNP